MRSGPLAPTRVTVVQAAEGRLTPALFGIGTVEARRSYLIGPTVAGRVRAVAVDVGDTRQGGPVAGRDGPGGPGRAHGRARRLGGARRQRHGRGGCAAPRRPGHARNWRRSTRAATSSWANRTSSAPAPSRPGCRSRHRPTPSSPPPTPTWPRPGRTSSAWRPSAPGCASSAPTCACWRPADGVVTSRDAEPGSTVVAGQAVLRLIEPSSLWVKVRLDQGRSAGLAGGPAGADRAAFEPRAAPCRQGRPRRSRQRQRDRRARGPGQLRPGCRPACRSANWPR